jgi:hypothetical protein
MHYFKSCGKMSQTLAEKIIIASNSNACVENFSHCRQDFSNETFWCLLAWISLLCSSSVTNICLIAGKCYWRGRLSTVDLLVLTSLDQLSFISKILTNFFTKQATLIRKPVVLSLSRQLVFPAHSISSYHTMKERLLHS